MTESAVTKMICANHGSMDVNELIVNYSHVSVRDIIANRQRFSFAVVNGEQRVIAKTALRLCKASDCLAPRCRNLHFCKRFLLGDCPFSRRRNGCRFGHDLTSELNTRLLREHGLEELNRTELCTLLLQNDTFLLPPVCHSYNNGVGEYGKCPDGENCRRLHICETYLRGTCNCSRAHDFYEPHPLKTLSDRGVPNELINSMKFAYMNIEALRDSAPAAANASRRTNKGSQSGQEKSSTSVDEICLYFVKGSCTHGDKCFRAHSILPYRWEIKEGLQWTALPDNEGIERDYCDPAKTYSRGVEPVCFDTMTCGLSKARRLSTVSSVLQPTFILTTQWTWHWEDEFGNWIRYASSSSSTHRSATITSDDLEQSFQSDNNGAMEFTAGSQAYVLSFQDMIQTNKQYGTKKVVRRRPLFVSAADAQAIKTSKRAPNPQSNFKGLPGHWDKLQTPETGYKRVVLQSSSAEYMEIKALFSKTLRGFSLRQIERIQNKALWEVFQWQRDVMKKNNRGRNVTEKQLFHGTDSKHIDAICHNNFDWRICGTHGTAFGKGSYFARDAKYSNSYAGQSSVKSMFVCRVLAGDYTTGHSSYLRPPSKDGGDTVFYDSCVDDVSDPSIFVVFEKHQVYPEYLIQYGDMLTHETATVQQNSYRPATVRSVPVTLPARAYTPAPAPARAPVYTPAPARAAVYTPAPGLFSSQNRKKESDNSCVVS